jgi:hypothetical protein
VELTMAVPPLVVPDVPASLADVEAAVVAWS